jgi:hypothetical protein
MFFIGISHEYINQNQIYVGPDQSFIGALHGHHDEVSTLNQITNFYLGYSITDFLTLNFKSSIHS